MSGIIETLFLSQYTIIAILSMAALLFSRWAVFSQKEYLGYGLGWLVALFFLVVYSSLGGDAEPNLDSNATLNIFQVFLATIMGMVFGGAVTGSLPIGLKYDRGMSLYVAFVTALNIILLFISIIEGPIAQRMIGIFALAFGITSGFILVLLSPKDGFNSQQAQGNNLQQSFDRNDIGTGQVASGTSRLERIREDMQRRNK